MRSMQPAVTSDCWNEADNNREEVVADGLGHLR